MIHTTISHLKRKEENRFCLNFWQHRGWFECFCCLLVQAVYLSVSQDGWERRNLWWRWSSSNTQDLRTRSDVPLCSRHHWISHSLTTTTTQTSEHWERPDRTAHHLQLFNVILNIVSQESTKILLLLLLIIILIIMSSQWCVVGGAYLFGLFFQHCSPQWSRSGKQRAKRRRFCRAGGPSWPASWFADSTKITKHVQGGRRACAELASDTLLLLLRSQPLFLSGAAQLSW